MVDIPLFEEPVDVHCLRDRGAMETIVRQRHGGDAASMRVWVLPPTSADG